MAKEVYAIIDGKEYTKRGFQLYIGKKCIHWGVKKFAYLGFKAEDIANILKLKEKKVNELLNTKFSNC